MKEKGKKIPCISVRVLQLVQLNSRNQFIRKKLSRNPAAHKPIWKFADKRFDNSTKLQLVIKMLKHKNVHKMI